MEKYQRNWQTGKMNSFGKTSHNLKVLRYIILIITVLVMTLPVFPAREAQAQDTPPVKLVFGGTGLQRWNISNIVPGNSHTETLILRNTGYKDGAVTIWLSNVISTNGRDPVTEQIDTSKPGDLQNYILFNLSSTRLTTNLTLPVLFRDFPLASDSPGYIRISRLYAGESLTLTWQWQLPPQTGNTVQGDALNFSINFLLDELPPETGFITSIVTLQGSMRPPEGYNVPLVFRCYSIDTEINTNNIFSAEPLFVFSTDNASMSIESFDTNAHTVTFRIPAVIVGDYNMTLYTSYGLINLRNNVNVNRDGISLNMGTIITGNAIEDIQIFGADFNALINDYLQTPSDANWNNGRSDFDRNGIVNSIDFSLLAMNYTLTSPRLVSD